MAVTLGDAYLGTRARRLMLLALIVAELAGAYETAMVYAALPTLFRVFKDVVGVSWLITIYLLSGSMFAVLSSRLGDIIGRTQMLLVVLATITVGSMISATSDSLLMIIVGRALQGSAAAILPLSFGIVRETVRGEKTPLMVGIITGFTSVGAGVGLIVGALLVDNFPWRSIFIFSAILGALSLLLVAICVPRKPVHAASLKGVDLLGGVLFAPALCGLLLVLARGSKWGFTSPATLALGVSSVALLALWIIHELRHPNPLIDVRLLGRRDIAITNTIMAFAGVGAFQITQVLTLLMQQPRWTFVGLGLSATLVGVIKLPANMCGLVGSITSVHLAVRWGARAAAGAAATMVTIGWLYMTFFHGTLMQIVIALFLLSFALPMLIAVAANIVIAAAPPDRISEATGLSAVIRTAVSALGSQLIALTLAASSIVGGADGKMRFPSAEAFFNTFVWITLCCFASALLILLLPRNAGSAPSLRGA